MEGVQGEHGIWMTTELGEERVSSDSIWGTFHTSRHQKKGLMKDRFFFQ